ncbi:MAG: S24 family peptidase, partial [Anaerolineales bacterium]
TYTHPHAISQWMIGCIHWATHQKVKAIASWQSSITLFKTQQDSLQIDTERVQWYNVIIPKLESYLELAIVSGELPVFEESDPHAQSASSEKKNSPSDEVTDTIKLLAYAVNDSVPAGGFRPTGYDPDQIGYLEISEVLIEHEPYKIYSTKRINPSPYTLNLTPPQEYRTVRVQGTSMNAARPIPINDGDYILVRLQGKARDNDIVVAGIFNTDTLATVKRLRYHGNKIQLIPESTDSNEEQNAELERDIASNEVNIVGIVEAIFKKKN